MMENGRDELPVRRGGMSMKGTGRGRAVPKRRELQSCRQCRERRRHCSRESPCEFCARKGEECDWTGAKPAIGVGGQTGGGVNVNRNRDQNDHEALTTRLNHLLALLENLTDRDRPFLSDPRISTVPVDGVADLASELQTLALTQAVPDHQFTSPDAAPHAPLVQEIQTMLDGEDNFNFTGHSSQSQQRQTEGILGLGHGPSSTVELLRELPTLSQMTLLFDQYELYCAWMHRILHSPTFKLQLHNFSWYSPQDYLGPDAEQRFHWVAVLFSVCGLALYNNTIPEDQCLAAGLPPKKNDQLLMGRRWLTCATSALYLGHFMEAPTLDAMRAMTILAQLPLYTSNGENLGAAISFISLGLSLAVKLDLNTDPDNLPMYANESDLVKQNRRRVMCALLCADWKMGGLITKKWALQDPSMYPIKLPFDNFDEDFDDNGMLTTSTPYTTQTIFTGVNARLQVSRTWQQIGLAFANVKSPPTHDAVMRLDSILLKTEADFPECLRTTFVLETGALEPSPHEGNPILATDRLASYAVYAGAHIRLHRGFMAVKDGVPPADVALHRKRVLYYGRMMLSLEGSKFFPLHCVPLQFFILSAAIALAVYCLTAGEDAPECDQVRKEVAEICELVGPWMRSSSILRRCHSVLRFLLQKEQERAEIIRERRTPKRVRTAISNSREDERGAKTGRTSAEVVEALASGSGEVYRHWPSPPGNSSEEEVYVHRPTHQQRDNNSQHQQYSNNSHHQQRDNNPPRNNNYVDNSHLHHHRPVVDLPQASQPEPTPFTYSSGFSQGFEFGFVTPQSFPFTPSPNTSTFPSMGLPEMSTPIADPAVVAALFDYTDQPAAPRSQPVLSHMPNTLQGTDTSTRLGGDRPRYFDDDFLTTDPLAGLPPGTQPMGNGNGHLANGYGTQVNWWDEPQ